jgi:hypothetical protein
MLDRVELLDNRDGGLVAFDAATIVGARNLVVRGTLAQECAVDTCAALAAGMGVVAVAGAQVDLRRFAVTDSALCGVQLVRDGAVDLHEGEVARNPIGANVQTAGFDPQRLGDQVAFRDNGRNLDTSTLPVPEPVVPAGP